MQAIKRAEVPDDLVGAVSFLTSDEPPSSPADDQRRRRPGAQLNALDEVDGCGAHRPIAMKARPSAPRPTAIHASIDHAGDDGRRASTMPI